MLLRACVLGVVLLGGCAAPVANRSMFASNRLSNAETAFAATMQDRDFAAFATHIADDAVFINGGQPLRGKEAILDHWKAFFSDASAPFSWSPQIAEIGGNGLGYTEGPVLDPAGKVIARFATTWQIQADGEWRVVFDNGHDVCPE